MLKIAVYLPNKVDNNDDCVNIYDDWNSKRVLEQTGIENRHYADQETSSSLGFNALNKLINDYHIEKDSIDFLICVTETPDNPLPATAYKIHQMAGLSKKCGAYDINHGCAGFAYGLLTAYNMIKANTAENIVLINVDILSKYMENSERSIRTLIGDAATACLINKDVCNNIMKFVYGTESSGYDNVIVKHKNDDKNLPLYLHMDGMSVFSFSMSAMPKIIKELISINNLVLNDIDMVIMHQANKTILESIKKRLKLPDERFYINMKETGNTASATIPIALYDIQQNKLVKDNSNILIMGFGVGYSWCGTILKWKY